MKHRFSSDADTELKYIVLSLQTEGKFLGAPHFFTCGLGSINSGAERHMKRRVISLAVLSLPSLLSFLSSLISHMFLLFLSLPFPFLPLIAILHRYSQPGPRSWLSSPHITQQPPYHWPSEACAVKGCPGCTEDSVL